MVLARSLDRRCCELSPGWFPCEGEEATIVGTFCELGPRDVAAVHYRDPFAVYYMRGASLSRLVGQVLGRSSGYTKGRAPPFSGPLEMGIIPWVAGDLGPSVAIATGAALARKYQRQGGVVVASFGDGTANRGDVHEALNLAAVWRLPIVFVCQNNQYSISLPVARGAAAPLVDRAAGYGMPGAAVDGNDVLAVREVVTQAIEHARSGAGPSLVECRTYRIRGHWAGDDTGAYRPAGEAEAWRGRDPIELFERTLIQRGLASAESLREVCADVAREVEAALAEAQAAPPAGPADLGADEVFAG